MEQAGTGRYDTESSFAVHGRTPQGQLVIRPIADTNGYRNEKFDLYPNDSDIVHVHPNSVDPKPSPGDRALADKHNVAVWTVSRAGLYRYAKGMKDPELVAGPEYLKAKSD